MSDFHGLPTAVLENKHLRLEYLTSAGPRIVGLSLHGSPNLLADVHDIAWDTPNGVYNPLGGHRLWISPEAPESTYTPDGSGLVVQEFKGGVELLWTGSEISKKVRIELEAENPIVQLVHTITNISKRKLKLAPWVITMFRLGGSVILPQPVGNTDPHGLLPNRLLVLWPYTRFHDPRLEWRDDFILVHAEASLPPAKLGYASKADWMAYWLDGIVFRKRFDLHAGAAYPDGGCNAETYCGDRFVELETLGPLGELAPGQRTRLTEIWELNSGLDVAFIPEGIRELLQK